MVHFYMILYTFEKTKQKQSEFSPLSSTQLQELVTGTNFTNTWRLFAFLLAAPSDTMSSLSINTLTKCAAILPPSQLPGLIML